MLRPLLRLAVPLVAICLVAESLLAASPNPDGTLRAGARAYVDGTPAEAETTLYSGDRLRAGETRATVSLPQGGLLLLGQQSQATFQNPGEALQVNLEKGRLVFSTTARKPLRVVPEELTFSTTEGSPSFADIALRGYGSRVPAVHRGTASLSELRENPFAVTAGQTLNISPRLAQSQQGSSPIGTGAHGKMTLREKLRTFQMGHLSHGASLAIMGGLLGGVAAAAIIPLALQPSRKPSLP